MAYYSVSRRNGKYCCQVRWLPVGSTKRKSTNKTFLKKDAALAWGRLRVLEIEAGDIGQHKQHTFAQLLDKYLTDPHVKMARSKRASLNMIRDCDLAALPTDKIQPKNIVDFCKDRRSAGAGPSTIACDISHIRAVLKSAEALYNIKADVDCIIKAMPTLHALHLVAKSNIRTRRPTSHELERLRAALKQRQSKDMSVIPFVDILDFSILSCMRIGEVCSILWSDFNEAEGYVLVRDRKDPRKKTGNHMKVPLLGGAKELILKQNKTDDPRIFPYNSRSVTAGFQRVRNTLGISDLRYHDLRREGASCLFEKGYTIDQVAQVTGHRDLNTLWRIYTDLHPSRLH